MHPLEARVPAELLDQLTVGVTSTVRNTHACGAVATLRTIASAMCFWTPRTGARDSRTDGVGAAPDDALPARSAAKSSRVMVPPGPWPVTWARSMPLWRAMKRTGGAARGREAGCAGSAVLGSRWERRLRRRLGGASVGP